MKKSILILLFSLAVISAIAQETYKKAKTMDEEWGTTTVGDTLLSKNASWYKDAKFAMFIHWGLYSEAGGEWEGKNYYGGTAFSLMTCFLYQDALRSGYALPPSISNGRETILTI